MTDPTSAQEARIQRIGLTAVTEAHYRQLAQYLIDTALWRYTTDDTETVRRLAAALQRYAGGDR